MKKSLHSLFIAAIVGVTVVCAHAAEALSEAVVLNVTGNAKAVVPGQEAKAVKVGDKFPQGTVIETEDGSVVDLQMFSGGKATIKQKSRVDLSKLSLTTEDGVITKQTAEINLSVGTVVSSLDPAKKAINDYSIRTPRGVAAARGTVFEVSVAPAGQVIVYVVRGRIEFKDKEGNSVFVDNNQVITVDDQGRISGPTEATEAQIEAGRRSSTGETNEAIDITIISPSA